MPALRKEVNIKSIKGVPGYLVGSDGSVWSQWKTRGRKGRRGVESFIDKNKLEPIKPRRHSGGYRSVALRCDGKYVYYLVHRLVLETFAGPCPENHEGCHKNGIKTDNRLSNLYWGTRKQNMEDSVRLDQVAYGERQGHAKLTEEQVKKIVQLVEADDLTYMEISGMFGVGSETIAGIAKGRSWKRVTGGVDRSIGHWSHRKSAPRVAAKAAAKLRGRKLSDKHCRAISDGMTKEVKEKMAESLKGRELTEEHKENISVGLLRRWRGHRDENGQVISDAERN